MWPFNKKPDAPNAALDKLAKKIDDLLMAKIVAEDVAQKLRSELATANETIAKLKPQIRAQTEADLYLVSAKIMRDILEKGKPQEVDVQRQSILQQQMKMYQQSQQAHSGGYGYYASGSNPNSLFGSIFG